MDPVNKIAINVIPTFILYILKNKNAKILTHISRLKNDKIPLKTPRRNTILIGCTNF